MRLLTVLALALALVPAARAVAPSLSAVRREADLRAADSALLRRAARSGALRREALRAMGRVQSPAYAADLAAALADRDPAVRAEAAFSLGQLALAEPAEGDEADAARLSELRAAAARALRPLLKAEDAGLRCAAAEALGKAGGSGVEGALVSALTADEPCLRREAAAGLFRLRSLKRVPAYSPTAVSGLTAALRAPDPELRWRAAYAFSRWPEPRAAEALAAAARDDDSWTRLFALRALGQLKAAAPLEALLAAQRDPDALVRREAAAALGAAGQAGRLEDAVFQDSSTHVRAAAAEALGADAGLGPRLALLLDDPSPMVRAAALLAAPRLIRDAAVVLAKAKDSPSWWVRSRACLAMADVPAARPLLLDGLKDPDPRVASAALEALAKSTEAPVAPILEGILRDPASSLELRGTAADAAAARADASLRDALEAAWRNSRGREWSEVRDSIRKAAQAVTGKPGYAGRPLFLPEPRARLVPSPYLGETPAPSSVVLETDKGEVEISLAVAEAPVHSAAFLRSVSTGLYDGLSWHRVASNFVVQGGDPRGSGWGDAGFSLRDEINPLRFDRGAVGMPKAGKDTGGCQLFITHVPTPHLDGRYTVFGRVARGMDVVDRLEPGDRILKARVK
ncbi:MAG: HEAT repeat domain-containing protein [Elusimicrobia bacterium]|nr:HEAT repeat domain-containing protein [Elusimicrobiota bacterium]